MSIFAVSFRIHKDETYDQRYDSTVDAIKGQTTSTYWEETTSFLLIESSASSDELATAISLNSNFDSSKDILLVINLSVTKGHQLIGASTDRDFTALMSRRR